VLTFYRRKCATQRLCAPPMRCLALLELMEDLGHPALLADGHGRPVAANFTFSIGLLAPEWGTDCVTHDCQVSDSIANVISRSAKQRLSTDVIEIQGEQKRVRLFNMGEHPPFHIGVFDQACLGPNPSVGAFAVDDPGQEFTRHESAIIEKLASGDTLANVADRSRVSYNTLRKQLRSVMIRSGAQTQAHLVAKYLASFRTERV
jgi:DNA-binding CsgD family transcriptional regulator